ncbi:CHASE2 domain-containing protein [Sphingomonas histidinilytica]|uniref:histidine kinase n=1 Tax=Rhizorhabdus histidinilytica TaxID=439228 RepID=A0A1T4ZRM2_9SPHN|nr:CHASE2 domain-containing protein [Rhizorhabdus histidinilytica]MBO9379812.1 CHASE2 domain-containing protein [Rhizorhabdus histidinilytica]SKB25431.1 sensor domain CHASE2-containing protein [Rhizorhabdus histidinilytica]
MALSSRSPSPPARLYAEWLAVAIVATLLIFALVTGRLTERLDHIVYDNLLTASGRPPPDDILIVAIDNRSLQAIGRWPWPRAIHAQALDRLAEARPRAIGYDVLFVEPSADDDLLAAAVRRTPTYLPMVIDVPGTDGAPYDIALPAGPLKDAAAGIAQVNLHFEDDRVIRTAYLEEGGGGRSWLQLSALMAGLKPDGSAARARHGLWQARPVLIPYGGAAGHVSSISFVDLLAGRVPAEFIRDRHVLIGATADGMGDSYPTPTSGVTGQMAGVEIQAQLLDALLRGEAITPAPRAWTLWLALCALWTMLVGFLRLSPRANANLALILIVALPLFSFLLFRFGHVWLPPSAALIGLLFVYPLWGWRRLQAISSYMTGELRQLDAENDAFPRRHRVLSVREVTLQAGLLGQAIDRLRDLRRFLSDAIGRLPDALFVTGLDGRLALTNAEGRRLARRLGAPSEVGADLRILLDRFRASDGTGFSPFAADAPVRGGTETATEDGGSFDIRYVAQRDAANAQVGWIIRIVDVTALKQAERHREEALQLLSHDMRAPQSAILALLRGPETGVPKAMAARIEGLANRTLDLAEDFVQLARAEAKPMDREPLDMNDLTIDAADALWPVAKARSIRVAVEGTDDPHLVDGDRQLLTRAILNLISNAIKYSDPGMRIRCSVSEAEGLIRVAVADEGVGMDEDQLANLFARFRQGPREGVGLGLTFVRTVVARHGGTIDCTSAPGKGTTFTITLRKSDVDPYADE